MVVKAKTVFTKELLKKSIRFMLFKKSLVMIFSGAELFMLGLSFNLISMAILSGETSQIIICAIVGTAIALIFPFVYFSLPSVATKKSKNMIGSFNTYEFLSDELIIESNLPTATGQTKAKYDFIFKVYEKKDIFYFYISKQQAFFVNKTDIYEGTVSDLQSILKNNLPAKKYKRK
jgi:hypothetical protein